MQKESLCNIAKGENMIKNKYQRIISWKEKGKKEKALFLVITFSLLFLLCASLVFSSWIVNNRSFVWEIDGSKQHYPALMYIGVWIRDIIRNIINGNGFVVPMWDMNLGYGADILTTFNYYSFGDPLDLLSIFVPYKYTEYLYSFLVVFRMYLAGLAFIYYCKKMQCRDYTTVVGAILYCFSGYSLIFSIRHPFFINPMIYLPLLLVGIEKLLKGKKSILFHIMVTISLISNFYYFYMLTIILFVYALLRYFQLYSERSWKGFLSIFWKSVLSYVLGVLNAMVIFLPVLLAFLGTERVNAGWPSNIFTYDSTYYGNLPSVFLMPGLNYSSTVIGMSGISILTFVILIVNRKKKNRAIRIMSIGMIVGLFIPMFGFGMNGFAYICNRWSFVFCFVIAYSFTILENELWKLKRRDWIAVLIICAIEILSVVCYPTVRNEKNMMAILLFFITVALVVMGNVIVKKGYGFTILRFIALIWIVVDIGIKAYYNYSLYEGNLISGYYERGSAYKRLTDDGISKSEVVKGDSGEFRVDALDRESRNYGILDEIPTVSSYFSITAGGNTEFSRMLGNAAEECTVSIGNLDSRLGLNALFGVKYISVDSNSGNKKIPYGYELVEENERKRYNGINTTSKVYENRLYPGMIYTYDKAMDRKEFSELPVSERESAMLNNMILESDSNILSYYSGNTEYTGERILNKEEILEQIDKEENIEVMNGKIYVYADNTDVELKFKGKEKSENYLYLENVSYTYMNKIEVNEMKNSNLSRLQKNVLKKESLLEAEPSFTRIKATTKVGSSLYEHKTDISTTKGIETALLNTGYSEEKMEDMAISFQHRGIYDIENMEVICQPMSYYEKSIEALSKDSVKELKIEENKIKGEIVLEEDKIVCIAVPYSKGWKAEINGEEVSVERGNVMFMALEGEKGKNVIEMTYCTPGLKAGGITTIISIAISVIYFVFSKKKYEINIM